MRDGGSVALASVGWSDLARASDRDDGDLALDAAVEALRSAGLSADDVDGVATHPGTKDGAPGPWYLATGLGLRNLEWYADVGGGPAAMAGLFAAIAAVRAGLAHTVVHFRAISRPRHRGAGAIVPTTPGLPDDWAFKVPYGAISAAQWIAMWATHHMQVFGTKPEHLGAVAVQTRAHATRNPRAVMREPMTLEQYLASPPVSDPFRLFDCDVPIAGAAAVVVTTLERARDLPHTPVVVEALSCAPGPVPDWDQWEDFRTSPAADTARSLWAQTDLGPDDVDVALLYDGFTFLTLAWLEALGFCDLGESGPFVEDGRIGPGGELPVNPHGGNLSEGRLHGMGHIAEAVAQLQHRAGPTQVEDARVAVVTNGGGALSGALLLRRAA